MTIELIEAPVVLPLKLKPDVRNQFGNPDTLGKNSGIGQQPGANLLATLPPKDADVPAAKTPIDSERTEQDGGFICRTLSRR